jgi:hypothetical protein
MELERASGASPPTRAFSDRLFAMPLLEEGPFLTELNKLYERHKTSGSVWVTMKRSAPPARRWRPLAAR